MRAPALRVQHELLPPVLGRGDGVSCEKELLTDGVCTSSLVLDFLQKCCDRCYDSVCANGAAARSLVDVAFAIWTSATKSSLSDVCVPAVGAALVVMLQLSPTFHDYFFEAPSSALEEMGINSTVMQLGLQPFPLALEFATLFQYFQPAAIAGDCNAKRIKQLPSGTVGPTPESELMVDRVLLVPRASSGATHCAIVAEDAHLAQRCISRRLRSYVFGGQSALQLDKVSVEDSGVEDSTFGWQCPQNETPIKMKYEHEPYRSCSSGLGSTGRLAGGALRCVLVVAAEALQVRPGASVFEWGCGCGWMLTWLHTLYGAQGYAIDASAPAIAWARRFSKGSFCVWGSTDLDWIPDASFDHVISYQSIFHLHPPSRQCVVILQLVSKLKKGGRAWFGGNTPWGVLEMQSYIGNGTRFTEQQWLRCLKRLPASWSRSYHIEFIHDLALFRANSQNFAELPGDPLFLEPAYSALVTRTE